METLEKELNQAEKFNFSFEEYIKNELNISLENNTGIILLLYVFLNMLIIKNINEFHK